MISATDRELLVLEYDPFRIGTTLSNRYIPLFVFEDLNSIVGQEYMYNHILPRSCKTTSKHKYTDVDFLNIMNGSDYAHGFYHGTGENRVEFVVGNGVIFDIEGNILLSLVVDYSAYPSIRSVPRQRKYVLNRPITEIDYSNYHLFISNEFARNKEYAAIYKKIEKCYINYAYEINLNVMFTSIERIEKLCFSNDFVMRFNTIGQLKSHMENVIPKLLFLRDSVMVRDNLYGSLEVDINDREDIYYPPEPVEEIPTEEVLEESESTLFVNLIDDLA